MGVSLLDPSPEDYIEVQQRPEHLKLRSRVEDHTITEGVQMGLFRAIKLTGKDMEASLWAFPGSFSVMQNGIGLREETMLAKVSGKKSSAMAQLAKSLP